MPRKLSKFEELTGIKVSTTTAAEICEIESALLDENGYEVPDPRPLFVHGKLTKPLSMQEQLERLMAGKLAQAAMEAEMETPEEAADLDIPDDTGYEDPNTVYQVMDEDVPEDIIPSKPEDPPEAPLPEEDPPAEEPPAP
jgi:hypothetical protein